MKTRITAAPTVQPISSRVLPWICAATRPLRARYLNSEQISRPSTPMKMTSASSEDQDVERPDAVGVRRAAGLRQEQQPADAAGAATRPRQARPAARSSRRRRAGLDRARTAPAVYGRRARDAAGHRPLERRRAASRGTPATPSRKSPEAAISCWIDGLELELLVHAREQPGVELALGAGVGARSGRRRAASASASTSRVELVVGDHAVDQAPLERLRRRDRARRASPSRPRGRSRRAPGRAATSRRRAPARCSRTRAGSRPTRAATTRSQASASEQPMPDRRRR